MEQTKKAGSTGSPEVPVCPADNWRIGMTGQGKDRGCKIKKEVVEGRDHRAV